MTNSPGYLYRRNLIYSPTITALLFIFIKFVKPKNMKKLSLFIALLLTVQLITAGTIPPANNNISTKNVTIKMNKHARRSATIVVNAYISNTAGVQVTTCVGASQYNGWVHNNATGIETPVNCPASNANMVASVGDNVYLILQPLGPELPILNSSWYTITQADIDKGSIDLEIVQ
jgi:hypothetical protein